MIEDSIEEEEQEFTCGEINEHICLDELLHPKLFLDMGYRTSNLVLVQCHCDSSLIGKCHVLELVGRQFKKGFLLAKVTWFNISMLRK